MSYIQRWIIAIAIQTSTCTANSYLPFLLWEDVVPALHSPLAPYLLIAPNSPKPGLS